MVPRCCAIRLRAAGSVGGNTVAPLGRGCRLVHDGRLRETRRSARSKQVTPPDYRAGAGQLTAVVRHVARLLTCALRTCMFDRRHPIRTAFWTVLLALVVWTAWRSTDLSLPPLARGVRWSGNGDTIFRNRIRTLYPIGSPEEALRRDLAEQGFAIEHHSGRSRAELSRFIGCGSLFWTVDWKAKSGRLTEARGIWGEVCL